MKYVTKVGTLTVELTDAHSITLERGEHRLVLSNADELRTVERAIGDLKFARKGDA